MAVRLEGSISRYIGLSTDDKPRVGVRVDGAIISASDLPDGSSYLEQDTGRIFRYHANEWRYGVTENDQGVYLSAILLELRALNEKLDLVTA